MNSDAQLLLRYTRTGDPMAFSEIASRYRNFVFGVARRIVRNHHDAEDVAQAVFVELASKASDVRDSLPGWLHRRSTTNALNHRRAAGRRVRQERDSIDYAPVSDHPSWDQIGPAIDSAIDQLPESFRHYVILYYLQEFSQDQVAEILNVSRATAGRKLREGILLLRESLDKSSTLSVTTLAFLLKSNVSITAPASLATSLAKIGIAGVGVPRSIRLAPPAIPNTARFSIPAVGWKAIIAGVAVGSVIFFTWQAGRHEGLRSDAHIPAAFDQIRKSYLTYLAEEDPLGLPLKIREAATSPYSLWCADQDLFFNWTRVNAQSLASSSNTRLSCILNPDLQDVALYAKENVERVAFRNSSGRTEVPLALELLHAAIALREVSEYQHLDVSSSARMDADRKLLAGYEAGVRGNASDVVQAFVALQPSLEHASKKTSVLWERIVGDVDGSWHIQNNRKGNGGPATRLEPADDQLETIRSALQSASVDHDVTESLDLAGSIRVFRILNPSSRFTMGQKRYLLGKMTAVGIGEILFELDQQIPASAARLNFEFSSTQPNQTQNETKRSDVEPEQLGQVRMNGQPFAIRGPESKRSTLKIVDIRTTADFLALAEAYGLLLGNGHTQEVQSSSIHQILTESLRVQLTMCADRYVQFHSELYQDLINDPRTRAAIDRSKGSANGINPLKDEF